MREAYIAGKNNPKGKLARQFVKEHFSVKAMSKTLLDAFSDAWKRRIRFRENHEELK